MDKFFLVFFPKKTLNLANCPPCTSQYGPIKTNVFQSLIIDLKVLPYQFIAFYVYWKYLNEGTLHAGVERYLNCVA